MNNENTNHTLDSFVNDIIVRAQFYLDNNEEVNPAVLRDMLFAVLPEQYYPAVRKITKKAAAQMVADKQQSEEQFRLRQKAKGELLRFCSNMEVCEQVSTILENVHSNLDLSTALLNIEAEGLIDLPELKSKEFRYAIVPILGYKPASDEALRQLIFRTFKTR